MNIGQHPARIFDQPVQQVVLPWRRALEMCWANMRHRAGRLTLVFLGIAVVVAFLVSSLTYHGILAELVRGDDVPTRAELKIQVGTIDGNEEACGLRASRLFGSHRHKQAS